MATIVELLSGDRLDLRLVREQDRKKLLVEDRKGRRSSVAADKVYFTHTAASLDALATRLEELTREVDVPLLWESLGDDDSAQEAAGLAQLYFDDDSPDHGSAVFRALSHDRLHFKRRGKAFTPRSAAELQKLRDQRQAEARAAQELADLQQALDAGRLDTELVRRLERFVRGGDDRQLDRVLEARSSDPRRGAFNALLSGGHLEFTDSLEVMQANLHQQHPEAVVAHAASLEPPPTREPVKSAAFSIDDPDTREVDDAVSVCEDEQGVRLDIYIADVAAVVDAGDPLDREALRRATTVYLPTGVYYMLPERVGCDLSSLTEDRPRPALRTSVWLNDAGEVKDYKLQQVSARVARRLDYEGADRLLASGEGETAAALGLLRRVTSRLAARRRDRGALFFQRPEWKIQVSPGAEQITVHPVLRDSPSRNMVAEVMILCNHLAARTARERGVPIIYRSQPEPTEPLPDVDQDSPGALEALRPFIKPASLSVHPAAHWGLGLECYTQISSPLRRYADLVAQRQLTAALHDRPLPYATEELLRVLATAEANEREVKRIEAAELERWSLEYVARMEQLTDIDCTVVGPHPAGGYRVEVDACGARGVLLDDGRHAPGEPVRVTIKTIRPRKGVLRVLLSS